MKRWWRRLRRSARPPGPEPVPPVEAVTAALRAERVWAVFGALGGEAALGSHDGVGAGLWAIPTADLQLMLALLQTVRAEDLALASELIAIERDRRERQFSALERYCYACAGADEADDLTVAQARRALAAALVLGWHRPPPSV